ncbi:hypothetical protein GCM10027040_25440 [Halomonas shantousis]
MKALLVKTKENSRTRSAMLRACTAFIYAHYEGFCKFSWETYLDEIEQDASLVVEKMVPDLVLLALRKLFKEARGNLSDEALWSLAHASLPAKLGLQPRFHIRPETDSNLWPNLLGDNLKCMGLVSEELEKYSTSLRSLVGKRNGIAHGERLTIKDIDEFVRYENAALVVMHDIALTMIDSIENRSYAID